MNFLSNLRDVLYNYSDKALIIGGDLNACLDPTFDKKGGKLEKRSVYSEHILGLTEELSLIDIW